MLAGTMMKNGMEGVSAKRSWAERLDQSGQQARDRQYNRHVVPLRLSVDTPLMERKSGS